MSKKPFFSVVISSKNSLKWLNKCFTSLQNQTFKNFEVILVDNASTDKGVAFVEKKFPWVKIVLNTVDQGPGIANNIGAKNSTGEFLFLMNTDSYLDDDGLEKLHKLLITNLNFNIVEINMKNYEKSNMDSPIYLFGMDIFGYPMPSKKPFYADVCGAAIRASLFKKLRGFDKTFYMYLDDLDLSWRARMLGEKVHMIDNIYIYHHTGGSSIATSTQYHEKNTYTTTYNRRYNAQKNNLRCILKNYSVLMIILTLPISTLLALGEGWLYLLKGNVQGFFIMHQAIWWNIVNFNSTMLERNLVQSARKVSDIEVIKYCEFGIAKLHSLRSHGVPLMQ